MVSRAGDISAISNKGNQTSINEIMLLLLHERLSGLPVAPC